MGPDPAVNAVFYNRIHAIEDPEERRPRSSPRSGAEYEDNVDLVHLAAELVVDAVVQTGGPARRTRSAPRPGREPGARRRP